MKINDRIFSNELRAKFSSKNHFELLNIDRELDGLIAAGVSLEWKGDILWFFPENSNLYEARSKLRMWLNLTGSEREVIIFPLPFGDPYVDNSIYPDFHIEKFKFFKMRLNRQPIIIIATILSASIGFEEPDEVESMILRVRVKKKTGRDQLIAKLYDMGYSHSNYVDGPGEFHKRGGILDIFPSGTEYPVRIEFFGDEIESITSFDPVTRRSVGQLDVAEIPIYGLFGKEMILNDLLLQKNIKPLTEILKNLKLIYSDKLAVERSSEESSENFRKIYRLNPGSGIKEPDDLFSEISRDHPYLDISWKTDEVTSKTELKKLKKNLREFKTEDLEELKTISYKQNMFLL
ncbi:MAG: hypothetical protein KAR14_14670, partial [Candidatus Aminicenantes bacterium]|nr:hypothetical protein [Candidatus Aminicenantes bacterium]